MTRHLMAGILLCVHLEVATAQDSPLALLPSGLLGPVTVRTGMWLEVK